MKKRIVSIILALGLLMGQAAALTPEQAGDILTRYYIEDVPEQVLEQTTVEEMLALLGDPYTVYYDPVTYASFASGMEDTRLVGIGIRAYYQEEGILLTRIAPDSPAREGGLQVGDYIITVDGHDTRGAAEADIDSWIHGAAGTSVTLRVLRGEETFEVTLVRRQVVFSTAVLEKVENRVGWIYCESFGTGTFQQFYEIITAHDEEVDEWVIDLRDNGGGNVLSALFSVGCFVGTGQGIYLRNRQGEYYGYLFRPGMITELGYFDGELTGFDEKGRLTSDPAHVLVGPETASAAELFGAVIRDAGAGLVIGERTYGKGVAQTVFDAGSEDVGHYFRDGGAMKVTTEQGYSKSGGTFHRVGVIPHIQVPADMADEAAAVLTAPFALDEERVYFRNLTANGRRVDHVAVPLSVLQAPESAKSVELILSALPATAECSRWQAEEECGLYVEEVAALCGVTVDRNVFSDVVQSDHARQINTMGVIGILHGDGDGAYRPEQEMSRAELCALLVKALRFSMPEGGSIFTDVSEEDWFAPYVKAMVQAGFMQGDEAGRFRPDDPVTHQEFITVLGRVGQWLNMDYYELTRPEGIFGSQLPSKEELEERFSAYADWARELAWLCDRRAIWNDPEDTDPLAATTREEAAISLYNLLRQSGVIPN